MIAPLVRDQLVCVLPMQTPLPDKPWLLEICPASTLKRESLYGLYKGKSAKHALARERILEAIEQSAPPLLVPETLRPVMLDDPGGDALDSLVAAFAVCQALRDPVGLVTANDGAYGLEGYVYV